MATKKIVFDSSSLPSISLSMIVKNESENLKRILAVVRGVVDEIIVVDTGSTDDTKQVAESFGAKVFDFPWCDDFSVARNESISHCTKDYILWLDADDYVERQDITKLKLFIKNHLGKAIFVSLLDKRWDRNFQSIQLRAFPNHQDIKFTGRVHEQLSIEVEAKGIKYATCDIKVHHLGYVSAESINEKLSRNLRILLEEIKANKDNFRTLVNIAKTYIGLKQLQEAEPFIDLALELMRQNKSMVSTDSEMVAILTKLNLLTAVGNHKAIPLLMDEFKSRLEHLPMFRLTYGEVAFKFKDYAKAYKNLLLIKNGKLNLSLMPVDANTLLTNMTTLLLASSLAIGDFRTAESCIQKIINDKEFKIKRS